MADFGQGVCGMGLCVLLLFLILSSFTVCGKQKDIKAPKLATFAAPTLKYANTLRQRFPDLLVEGDNFPPPPWRAMAAQALGVAKLVLIGLVVAGFNPFTHLNLPTPGAYSWAIENKIYACLMVFFISNAAEGQLISTGAFEIFYNDVPIWSKLEKGRVPSPQEMVRLVIEMQRATRQAR
ncbi:hypothetical protein ACOMHN_039604 [Nucella lapillus]